MKYIYFVVERTEADGSDDGCALIRGVTTMRRVAEELLTEVEAEQNLAAYYEIFSVPTNEVIEGKYKLEGREVT